MDKIFWSASKSDSGKYDNIRKTATGQGNHYTIGCLLDYPYFEKYFCNRFK